MPKVKISKKIITCNSYTLYTPKHSHPYPHPHKHTHPHPHPHPHTSWVYTYLHTQGYYGQSGFIAAQAPLKNTIEDTWNVIREQNCSVVVVLCDFVELGQVRTITNVSYIIANISLFRCS